MQGLANECFYSHTILLWGIIHLHPERGCSQMYKVTRVFLSHKYDLWVGCRFVMVERQNKFPFTSFSFSKLYTSLTPTIYSIL